VVKCGQLKKFVVPDPSVTYQRLQPGDEYVIIGSDGLWDVVYPNTAASMVGFLSSACLMRACM
jgi:serine/threonine protein phosphatase PrpC